MGSSDPSIFKTTCHSQLIYPGILRGGPRVLLPEDPIVKLLKFHIFESTMFIYSIGYHWTYYFHYLTERQYLPIRLAYFNDCKRVSLDPTLKRCRVHSTWDPVRILNVTSRKFHLTTQTCFQSYLMEILEIPLLTFFS